MQKQEEEYKPEMLKNNKQTVQLNDINVEEVDNEAAIPNENNNIQDTKTIRSVKRELTNSRIINNNIQEGLAPNDVVKQLSRHEDLLDNEDMDRMINPILFVRGVASDSFYLIL